MTDVFACSFPVSEFVVTEFSDECVHLHVVRTHIGKLDAIIGAQMSIAVQCVTMWSQVLVSCQIDVFVTAVANAGYCEVVLYDQVLSAVDFGGGIL